VTDIVIEEASEKRASEWDAFVGAHPRASIYHLWKWKSILGHHLGHGEHYLTARLGDEIVGVLPLIRIRRPWGSGLLVSLPFVTYGGILCSNGEVYRALSAKAIELCERLGCQSLELRHKTRDYAWLPARTDRVSMILELPENPEMLWKSLKAKVRNQVRKAKKSGLEIMCGGVEFLPGFYTVFAKNMHDLGSPAWSRAFFEDILNTFADEARLYLVRKDGLDVAAGLVLRTGSRAEIPWASSLRAYNHLCGNTMMYWEILSASIREGCSTFDFGRSAPGSGPYRFKKQWGARELPLYWHGWPPLLTRSGVLDRHRERVSAWWSGLPPWVVDAIGPRVRPWLPQ